ncbi:multisubunit sodium/proton antiporter, MrpE subunit [Fodinibius roseus]|uniref:Multisubunit sodium/proton antiporter, MrpE subunit n=1 Tax=Fodinibius roseus TaxID=1194090 RepID=A0A1M5BC54_9BACT|nr:Na+/H+ antiporter subunit E [Fodinibius roseus]SHF40103.1 multisubunit sodium/proton antiporter, MrpE subunit [Fodinibius roseus]
MKTLSLRNFVVSFITLMTFWYIMSGFFDPIHSLMGVASVAGVMALNYQLRKHKYFEDEVDVLDELRYGRLMFYLLWMVMQIVLSGIQVAILIITPSLPVRQRMVRFKVDLPSAHAKMILGNSITLTPGTLTVDIHEDEFLVHSIDPKAYEGIVNDKMPREVLKLFTSEMHPVVSDVEIISDNENL